jgi:membrane fusion protein (multidrug efflux system)
VALAIGWVLLWLFYLRYHETTDDAYVSGNMINVTSVIPGSPIAFFADDTDLVKEGQLLVLLDCTEYQIKFDLELETLASTVLRVRQLYDNVKQNTANVENKRIMLERARYDYENRSKLVNTLAISNEDYIHSKDDFTLAEINYRQAQHQLDIAIDAAGNTPIERHPDIEAQKARVRQAFYFVRHCSIYAPATGFIAQRQVEVGQWATPSTPLMAIIPINYMWVDANFKETQLTYMRIGQPATVTFDIYGKHPVFEGKVLGIASGTGNVFSLIPPQNATGNWIKIVQRLPVRIGIDLEKYKNYPLRLGLSAYVNVDISKTDLPPLATIPANKPVGITTVYDIDFKEVEPLIEKIIQENLAIPRE